MRPVTADIHRPLHLLTVIKVGRSTDLGQQTNLAESRVAATSLR